MASPTDTRPPPIASGIANPLTEALDALRQRVPRLQFADPGNARGSTFARLARLVDAYILQIEEARSTGSTARMGATDAVDSTNDGPFTNPGIPTPGILGDTSELAAAIDAVLADPTAEVHLDDLTATLSRIKANLTAGPIERAPGTTAADPWPVQHEISPMERQRVELHRLDEAERYWWQTQFRGLRRETTLAQALGVIALAWLSGLLLMDSRAVPVSPAMMDFGDTGGQTGWDSPGAPGGGIGSDYRSLRKTQERMEELSVKVLELAGRIEAMEAQQAAAELAQEGASRINPKAGGAGGPEQPPRPSRAATPVPPTSEGRFAIQLATLMDIRQVPSFLRQHRLEPGAVRIERNGLRAILLLGMFQDQTAASEAILQLPDSLRRSKPIVRSFQPEDPLPPIFQQ